MTATARSTDTAVQHAPARAGLVLATLILVAGVANLNLSVANVALPDIGRHFDSSQTTLDLIAVGYSLGLAASVLYLGALGDRYGRKLMLLLGMALSVPACLLAAFAPSDIVLFVARVIGGLSAGMAYPTTLALIAALWSGPERTKSIALWSALGGAIASLGPLVSGASRPTRRDRGGDIEREVKPVEPREPADLDVRDVRVYEWCGGKHESSCSPATAPSSACWAVLLASPPVNTPPAGCLRSCGTRQAIATRRCNSHATIRLG
jgi:hypothetical protein